MYHETNWKRHLRSDDKERCVCKIVDVAFSSYTSMKHHARIHTSETTKGPVVCDQCGKWIKRASNFKSHMKSHDHIKTKRNSKLHLPTEMHTADAAATENCLDPHVHACTGAVDSV